MQVLYNGETQEVDVSANPNHKNILDGLAARKKYLGQQVGDFMVVKVDYDWGIGKPVNKVKCVCCGFEKDVSDLGAWRRGRGERRLCQCSKQKNKKQERTKKKEYSEYVGETINGFRLLSYEVGKGFQVECVECGKQKRANGKAIVDGHVKCDHHIKATYDDSLIGQKFGHLTAVEHIGRYFKFQCDCGAEKILAPSDVYHGAITTCGRSECEYHRETNVNPETKKAIEEGFAFEKRFAAVFKSAGYEVVKTPDTGDFGVDVIVWIKGEKWAFQCKKSKTPSGVRAVAEVYAGGRYYDCTRFCVASPSGFTYQARRMAAKLGVQLETKVFHFNVSTEQNATELLQTTPVKWENSKKLMWEIDGVVKSADQWCEEYGISRGAVVSRVKNGMDLKTALATKKHAGRITVEIDGITKTKKEWCDEHGISPQLYDYRVKYSGLSPIEALTKPRENNCRA